MPPVRGRVFTNNEAGNLSSFERNHNVRQDDWGMIGQGTTGFQPVASRFTSPQNFISRNHGQAEIPIVFILYWCNAVREIEVTGFARIQATKLHRTIGPKQNRSISKRFASGLGSCSIKIFSQLKRLATEQDLQYESAQPFGRLKT